MRTRTVAFVAVVLAAVCGMAAADVAGSEMAACGECRTKVRRSRVRDEGRLLNWRLRFGGEPGDAEGGGTLRWMNAEGSRQVGESPFTWTRKNRRRVDAAFAGEAFGLLLQERHLAPLEEGASLVRLERAEGKGSLDREGNLRRLKVQVRGEVALRGGAVHAFRMKVRMR